MKTHLFILALVPNILFSQDFGSLRVECRNYEDENIKNYEIVFFNSTDTFKLACNTTNNCKLKNITEGTYTLTLKIENHFEKVAAGVMIAKNKITLMRIKTDYPCQYYLQNDCPVASNKHKIFPINYIALYGNDSLYHKRKGKVINYYNSNLKSDCKPDSYCKKHKVYF